MNILYDSFIIYSTLVVSYLTGSFIGYYLDYNQILTKYKIKNRTKEEYHELYKNLAPRVLKNVCIYSYPYIYGMLYINNKININSHEYYDFEYKIFHILNLLKFSYYYFISIIITDIVFYTGHYLLHSKYLYKYHKIHHEIINPISISALYVHPLDLYISNLTPISCSLLILNYNIFTLQILIVIQILFTTLIGHGGYRKLSEDHYIHHAKFIYNYGICSYKLNMDHLMNTKYIKPMIEIIDTNK